MAILEEEIEPTPLPDGAGQGTNPCRTGPVNNVGQGLVPCGTDVADRDTRGLRPTATENLPLPLGEGWGEGDRVGGHGSVGDNPLPYGSSLNRRHLAVTPGGLWAAAQTLWRVLFSPLLGNVAALSFLFACSLVLFRTSLLDGQYYYRSDTVTYYYPIANSVMDLIREGKLLLWTPYIFGGFPLFADGEAGQLYPPNLLASLLLPEYQAILWLRITRYFMASVFTYIYLQTLNLGKVASVIGGLTFAFGSFLVMQMHHTNVGNTAIWLPLTLAMVEMAVRNVRRPRWLFATAAGVSMGIQATGLHIQPLLMTGLFLAAYLPFRVLLCPIAWPEGRRGRQLQHRNPGRPGRAGTLVARAWCASISATALAGGRLSAAVDRARPWVRTQQGWGWTGAPPRGEDEGFAPSPGSVRPFSAGIERWWRQTGDDLRLPAARVGRSGRQFLHYGALSLGWAGHQAGRAFHRVVLLGLLVAGIPAIAFGLAAAQIFPLAELGLFSFRGTGVTYQFATSYSMPLQNLINLVFPYFFRYTNRFYWSLWSEWETTLYVGVASLALVAVAMIFVRNRLVLFFGAGLAVSLLLAFGGYSPYPLVEQVRQLPGFSSLRVPGRFTMLATFCAAVLAAYGADWLSRNLRPVRSGARDGWWKRLRRSVAINGFGLYLLGLGAVMAGVAWWLLGFRSWLEKDPGAVRRFVETSYLSLRNDRTWLTPDMILTYLGYSLDPTNEKTATGLALMLATFLLLFCWFAFRRLWRVWSLLLALLVAADLLLFSMDFHPTMAQQQLDTPNGAARWLMEHNPDGMQRVYSAREVRRTEANRLLPFKVPEVTGYSSLQTTRHLEYMAKAVEADKVLLDLYNVHYVVIPKRSPALPSYELTAYHPTRPLAEGSASNRGAHVSFYLDPPVRADEVSFISSLQDAVGIPQDAEVAEVVLISPSGERATVKLRAGRDTAEWAYDRADVTPIVKHQKARVAARQPVQDEIGQRYDANLYFGESKLDATRTVSRVEFHYSYPKGKARLFGLMLWENPGTTHQLLGRNKFVPQYEDDEVIIAENPSRLPRAYLVPTARVVKPSEMLPTMAQGDFDPEKVVLLEAGSAPPSLPPATVGGLLPDPKELAKTVERWRQAQTGVVDPGKVQDWLKGNPDSRPGSAEIVSYQPNEVVIRASSDRNSMLFLADSYYPGWRATVDGREEEIVRANFLFRAVRVPAGEHTVRFSFEPESFFLGSQISVFTVWSVALLWAVLLASFPVLKVGGWVVRSLRSRRKRDAAKP